MVLEAGQEEEIAAINKLFPPLSMESTRLHSYSNMYVELIVHSRQKAMRSILIILHFLFSCCVCVVCSRELRVSRVRGSFHIS